MSVTVITPTIPSRKRMLDECCASVQIQTRAPDAHLIAVDHDRRGTSAMRNALAAAVETEWVAVLDDDDLFLPHHLGTLLNRSDVGADIVYSFCEVEGRPGWNPNREFDEAALRWGNFIPATTLIRYSLLTELGGWRHSHEVDHGWEDWDLWRRALDVGARFLCVPEITWVYRFHGGNKTIRGERWAA